MVFHPCRQGSFQMSANGYSILCHDHHNENTNGRSGCRIVRSLISKLCISMFQSVRVCGLVRIYTLIAYNRKRLSCRGLNYCPQQLFQCRTHNGKSKRFDDGVHSEVSQQQGAKQLIARTLDRLNYAYCLLLEFLYISWSHPISVLVQTHYATAEQS